MVGGDGFNQGNLGCMGWLSMMKLANRLNDQPGSMEQPPKGSPLHVVFVSSLELVPFLWFNGNQIETM